MSDVLTPDALVESLEAIGAERYHDRHPYHRSMREGGCSRAEIQAWALNRYYYQSRIPMKDAIILSRMEDADLRRAWRQRILDHDGERAGEGGIERWLKLAEGVGLARDDVMATRGILPATRFAVDAYLALVRERSLLEAIASSLTELFSPRIIQDRTAGMLANYPFITPDILAYFSARPQQARRDVDVALAYVRRHAVTAEQQKAVQAALRTKCDILWAMLDALSHAYGPNGQIPPGAWRP